MSAKAASSDSPGSNPGPGRIISLLPSATEIVHGLGFGANLVGRSHECDFPAGVEALPVCTRPRVILEGSSADIDRSVKQALQDAVAIYEVLKDKLSELAPDLLVTQDQCDVCAVSLAEVELALAATLGTAARIVSLNPTDLAAVYMDIARVATALGAEAAGTSLINEMTDRIGAVAAKTSAIQNRPRIATIEWCDPLMAAGNWVPELISLAGGIDIFGNAGQHAPWIEDAALLAADPDVIIFMPCGFDLARTHAEARACLERPGWSSLKAATTGRIYSTDANAYFNRPGPRLANSTEILGEIVHPELFGENGHGTSWRRIAPPDVHDA